MSDPRFFKPQKETSELIVKQIKHLIMRLLKEMKGGVADFTSKNNPQFTDDYVQFSRLFNQLKVHASQGDPQAQAELKRLVKMANPLYHELTSGNENFSKILTTPVVLTRILQGAKDQSEYRQDESAASNPTPPPA